MPRQFLIHTLNHDNKTLIREPLTLIRMTKDKKDLVVFSWGEDTARTHRILDRQKDHFYKCPASPEQRRPSASSRTHSDGPVSQTLLNSDFKRRELLRAFGTLDDSTPQ